MASIFRRDDNYSESPNRNTVDMSFQNNLTTNFGSLRPCFIKPVMPGESLSIKPTFGLKFLPMVFPVQTRMKASIHFFYVRNRNLWKDWQDFIGKTKDGLVPPYINVNEVNRKMFSTSQLGDYLGIPTKVYGEIFDTESIGLFGISNGVPIGNGSFDTSKMIQLAANYIAPSVGSLLSDFSAGSAINTSYQGLNVISFLLSGGDIVNAQSVADGELYLDLNFANFPTSVSPTQVSVAVYDLNLKLLYIKDKVSVDNTYNTRISIDELASVVPSRENVYVLVWNNVYSSYNADMSVDVSFTWKKAEGLDSADMMLSQLPWRSDDNPSGIPLSALPFRAYESIYNSFYRNAENNPLLIKGVPEYNKWLRNTDGGADNLMYPIYYHNWEDDFLTTAVPSPQQGNAPLVGLSGTPTLTVAHDDGTTTEMQLNVDDTGNVTAATAVSGDTATQNALIDAVSYGISINDFRNVNAFQRWLENNIRRGYKYRDQIKTHYGVTVRYDELDMPEFIGGVSENVMVNQISQTVSSDTQVLGDYAGQASAVGQGNTITHYCDEHGFIIGILCVKPVANYSQLLPKFFNVTDAFDYYFPEFGHIGMQPIKYSEVTPLQANLEGKLNDTFGYQRAWYDLIASTDEVHGLFRSDFRNYLINRTFDGTPELGAEFTVMDPEQINDVFAYTGDTDKILGQIYFDCSKKTPIPLYGIPKLE